MIVENLSTYTASENTTNHCMRMNSAPFSSNGFVSLTSIARTDEVAAIRKILQDLVDRRAGEKEGSFFDTMEGSNTRGVLRSIQSTIPASIIANCWKQIMCAMPHESLSSCSLHSAFC